MKKLLNTLYVTTPDAYLSLDGENIVLLQDKSELGRVPLHNLEGIVCFGYRGVSPALMGACAERGIGLCFLTPHGRFLSRISGPVSGNVILRKTQYFQAEDERRSLEIAKSFLLGKIYNGRWCLERLKRDHPMRINQERLDTAIRQMLRSIAELEKAQTSDDLWNSAQRQLIKEGKIHGYMRMYWAKQFLLWTQTPLQALKYAIYLNDKYAYDAPAASGYVGILWSIGALHDRAFQQRYIFGKVRSMTYNGAKSKFDVDKYIQKYR